MGAWLYDMGTAHGNYIWVHGHYTWVHGYYTGSGHYSKCDYNFLAIRIFTCYTCLMSMSTFAPLSVK